MAIGTIPKTMKALVAYGKGDYRLEQNYPTPECGPDDIIIKTEGCGICAGDLKCMHGVAKFWGDDIQPRWVKPPFIPGHEFFGRVVQIGENVKDYKIGDRLTSDQIVPCGKCRFCRTGHYWMCQPHDMYGYQYYNNGGMAEYVKYLPNSINMGTVYKVPEELPFEKAVLVEPYACSKHAVDRAGITNDDVVVISGAGTLGLGMITYARMKNPKKLIVLDMKANRLEKAKEFGADEVYNPGECNIDEVIKGETDGYGCDIYIEATGNPASVRQGLTIIRKLGTFVEFSVFGSETSVDWSIIGDSKELDIRGSHLSPYTYPFVMENMMNGNLKTDGVVSHIFTLDDWEKAFDLATGKEGDFKVVFKFD